eukprot:711695-Amphidinium_carterae.2
MAGAQQFKWWLGAIRDRAMRVAWAGCYMKVLATLERWSGVKAPPSIAQAFSSRLPFESLCSPLEKNGD